MILPSDPLVVSQPGFRSGPVSDSSTWVASERIQSNSNKIYDKYFENLLFHLKAE